MATAKMSDSARIRSKLDHPIVDVDGHVVELTPVILEFITQVGGGKMAEAYLQAPRIREFYHRGNVARPAEERRDMWSTMGHWWSQPVDTLDRATVAMPRLLNERLEEFGIDFTTLYPSEGLFISSIEDPELRRVCCRAYNKYTADVLSEYSDRMTGVAIAPMITPEEAVGELEYSMNDLGLKAAVFSASVRRPIAKAEREHPEAAYLAGRMELFAIDSDHDYDKLWAKCVELKVAVTFHGGIGSAGSASYSNYIFNHIGGLAKGNSQMCKALLMGGVTRRFPTLKFAFLEGGVGWAVQLLSDLVGHWEKRNGKTIHTLNPDLLDRERFMALVEQYGDDTTRARAVEIRALFDAGSPHPEVIDDFAACEIETAEELRDLFVPNFYFGCEADDPVNAAAYNTKLNPFGATLQIIFGSDIGHWDVPVLNEVLKEAWELVEHEAIDLEQFKQFTFSNPVKLHASLNRDFFKGTRVEADVDKLLAVES